MDENLGICLAVENTPGFFEFGSQITEIINGAVEYHCNRAVAAHHRLPSGVGQIEDRQAAVSENGRRPALDTLAVWPSPFQIISHGRDRVTGTSHIFTTYKSRDSAHN